MTEAPAISHVGVVGAGVMGRGVAQDLAQTGHRVTVLDLDDRILAEAEDEIGRNTRFHHLVAGTGSRFDTAEVLGRIDFVTEYTSLRAAEFVVENVTEDWQVKSGIYPELDRVCKPDVVLAANTSAIPIKRLALLTARPGRVVGMHFMNPVPLKPVVEVIRTDETTDDTLATVRRLLDQMNKRAIVVRDSPGFVSNRVLMLTVNEAVALVNEGVATAEEVDEIFKGCMGHPMGPLETADLIGLDTIVKSLEVLQNEFNDEKYAANPMLVAMVNNGHLGRKGGGGFYAYSTPNQGAP